MRTLIPQNDTMKHLQLTIYTGLSILFAVANPLHARAD